MEQLARTFIILEMLFVNLITSHRCSRRKYSLIRIIAELTLFTVLIFLVSFVIKLKFHLKYVNPSITLLLGFTYFFPLKHLYHESSNKTLTIMFFSWIHTMVVTYLSIQTSILLGFKNHFQIALIAQTIIYVFSTPAIIRFVKNKFLYILRNISNEMNKYLIILSLVEFTTLFMIHLYFMKNTSSYLGVIMVTLVVLAVIISYQLIYIIVKNFKNISFLKQLAYSDALTGIKNRLILFLDCEKLVSENKPFTYIYMDLDNFKKVNDTYGHSVGDDYLRQFTKATIETIGDKGSIYRMSGDEFICIYEEDKVDLFLATFEKKIMDFFDMNIPFLGVSIGCAKFPEDADSLDVLIKIADRIMYKVKNAKRIKPI
ncbi:MAG: GGDEF domain-containing protein [Clostridia bacterium]